MLLGSEIGAALTALEPLGIDMIGLNCATGPAEMSEHLRYLARHSRIPLLCMPNAGLPVLGKDGAHYPLDRRRAGRRPGDLRPRVRPLPGRRLLRYHPGAPAPGRRAGPRRRARHRATRAPSRAPPRSTRPSRSARTPRTSRSASAPTPTGRRSSARPCWRPAGTTASRWPATRSARARTCSTSASTTSAATASPTWTSWPAGSPPPPPCRSCSTPPSCPCCGPAWRSSAAGR